MSPDYPCLHPDVHRPSGKWADAMHWDGTGERIARGIGRLSAMPRSLSRDKALVLDCDAEGGRPCQRPPSAPEARRGICG
ncbi:MAG: hypothetical protein KKA55_12300 [Proteobacteria bacterium]|nr:hypothetical protein [Pseudomonadota bacterium]MBU1596299.1 hypothetical protein [Pseudomonadota bacterium]